MRWTRIQAFTSACCLAMPLAVTAQISPVESTNPAAASSTMDASTPSAPGSPSSQVTPSQRSTSFLSSNSTLEPGGAGAESDAQVMRDKKFLEDATQGGMSEVQMGQLASDKASNPKVKAFGQKMVTDHTMLNNELKPFADKMGVEPPAGLDAEDQAELDKLNGLSGSAFDKEYVSYMMKDHDKDLKDFRKEVATTGNPALKAAVAKGEKVIYQHHEMIDRIGASMNVHAAS